MCGRATRARWVGKFEAWKTFLTSSCLLFMDRYFIACAVVTITSSTLIYEAAGPRGLEGVVLPEANQSASKSTMLVWEGVPQMTNTNDCEVKTMLEWVCRDGNTMTIGHSGRAYLYKLGPINPPPQPLRDH